MSTAENAAMTAVGDALGERHHPPLKWTPQAEPKLPRTSRLKGTVYDITIRVDEIAGYLVGFAYTDSNLGKSTASFSTLDDALNWIGAHVQMQGRDDAGA